MTEIDLSTLTPEIAAYIRALEAKNQKLEEENRAQKDALVRLQSLNEQLVCLRKRMFGQSSEKIEYVDCKQLDFSMKRKSAVMPQLPSREKPFRWRPIHEKQSVLRLSSPKVWSTRRSYVSCRRMSGSAPGAALRWFGSVKNTFALSLPLSLQKSL